MKKENIMELLIKISDNVVYSKIKLKTNFLYPTKH